MKYTVTLDERTMLFLELLVRAPSFVSIDEVTEKLRLSKRKVYYDLEKINSWLQSYTLEPVRYYRSQGFTLSEEAKLKAPLFMQCSMSWQYFYSPKERKIWLLIYLLVRPHKLLMNDLMITIRLSRATIHKELDQLKQELAEFDLRIIFDRNDGYILSGKEINMRKVFAHYIFQLLTRTTWLELASQLQQLFYEKEGEGLKRAFQPELLKGISQAIQQYERESGNQLTDEMMQNLTFRFAFFIGRMIQGNLVVINEFEKEVVRKTPEFKCVKQMISKLEKMYGTLFPEDEIDYAAIHILSAKVNHVFPQTIDHDTGHTQKMQKIVQMMINDFQKLSLMYFTQREELESNLLMHLKPAYYRIKYGLEIHNPLAGMIKQKYMEIFQFAKLAVIHFEQYVGLKMGDEEIAYIAMHFGGWMRKQNADPVNRMKAMVVCSSGISSSRIVQNQLENLFPYLDFMDSISVREYESRMFDVEIFFSTLPIAMKEKPVFLVSTILNNAEKVALFNQVNSLRNKQQRGYDSSIKSLMELIKRHATVHDEQKLLDEVANYYHPKRFQIKEFRKPMINELLTEEMIQIKGSAESWQGAIKQASIPLINKGMITSEYVNAMIGKVEQLGPYFVMAPKIAFPHARPEEGVKQLGISLLSLKESVAFSKESRHQVNLLFVIAAIDNETHLKALTQLSTMLADANNVNRLLAADSPEPILELINQYSTI